MEESRFWQLIEHARHSGQRFTSALSAALLELPDEELFGFQNELERRMADSKRAELTGAAFLVLGTGSEHRAADFRAWVVGQGEHAYRAALKDPDLLAELDWEWPPEQPELVHLAERAWKTRTGRDDFLERLPDVEIDEAPWGDDSELCVSTVPNRALLGQRYPKLAARALRERDAPGAGPLAPRALIDLDSADPLVRRDARRQLRRTHGQLGPDHVRLLVQKACSARTPERGKLVRLIGDFCVEHSERWAIDGFDLDAPRLLGYFDRAPLSRGRYETVEHALPALLTLLSDSEPDVRAGAAMTVSWFAHEASRVRAALARALPVEREPYVVASLLLALALQDRYLHDEGSMPLVEANLSEPGPIGDAAAIALYGYGEEPAPEAFARIAELLRERTEPVAGIPWNHGDLACLGLDAIRERLPARAMEASGLLLELVEHRDASDRVASKALPLLSWLVLRSAAPGELLAAPTSEMAARAAELAKAAGVPDEAELERLALLVVIATVAAERHGGEPDAAFDGIAEAALRAPTSFAFFPRYLSRLGAARQRRVLEPLLERGFAPACTGAWVPPLNELAPALLGVLGPDLREGVLERILRVNHRLVIELLRAYPCRRVLGELLVRVMASLDDLERWAPDAVTRAIERDASALAKLGPDLLPALGEAAALAARAPAAKFLQRLREKLDG